MYQDVAVDLRVQARPRSVAERWVAVAGWAYLAAVLVLLAFRVVPVGQARWVHLFGVPLYAAWAFLDYGSFLTAAVASLAFVQVEPAPFDFLALVLMVASLARRASRPRCVPAEVGAWLLVASLMVGLFSVAWWLDFAGGLRFFGITFYLCALMLCLFRASEPEVLRPLVRGWVVGATAAVCLSMLALLWRSGLTGHLLYSTPIVAANPLSFRARGFFKDPNVFGGFLAPAALFALDAACRRFRTGARFWLPPACAFVLCCLGVVLSYSRGAAMALLCVLLAYLALVSFRPRPRRLALRALVLVTVAAAVVFAFMSCAALWPAAMTRYRVQWYDVVRMRVQGAALSTSLSGESVTPAPVVTPTPPPAKPSSSPAPAKPPASAPPAKAPASSPGTVPAGSSPGGAPAPAPKAPTSPPPAKTPAQAGPAAAPARPPLKPVPPPSLVQQLLIGIGPGQVESIYGRSAHSLYIRLLAEGGVTSLSLFLVGLGLLFFAPAWKAGRRGGESAGPLVAIALAGMLAQGATIDVVHWRHLWVLLALLPVAFWRLLASPPGPAGAGLTPAGVGRAPAGPGRTPARRRRRRRRREWAHSFEAQDTRWRLSASGRWSTTRSSRPVPGVPWGRGEQPGRGVLARRPGLCYNQDVNAIRSREGAAGPGRRLPEGKG